MADRQISELPTVSTVDDNIQFPVSQNDTAMKLLISDLKMHFANYVREDIEDKVSDAIDDWFATHGNIGGTLCVINAAASPFTSSMTYAELYRTLVTNRQSVAFLFLDSGGTEYVSSLAFVDSSRIRIVFILPKSDGTYPVIYVNITNADAITIAVDNIGSGSDGSSDTVVLTVDENGDVFNGSDAINGSQINNLAATNKAVFLWDTDNDRLYTYLKPNGDGSATFVAQEPNGNGCYRIIVAATSNSSDFVAKQMLPQVNEYDNGMVLGVAGGQWRAVDQPAKPLYVNYIQSTGDFDSSYADIRSAVSAGKDVICKIVSGYSVFYARLARDKSGSVQEGEDMFSFDCSTYHSDASEMWWSSLKVYSNDNVVYNEGTISVSARS